MVTSLSMSTEAEIHPYTRAYHRFTLSAQTMARHQEPQSGPPSRGAIMHILTLQALGGRCPALSRRSRSRHAEANLHSSARSADGQNRVARHLPGWQMIMTGVARDFHPRPPG